MNHRRNAFVYASIVALGGFVFGLDAALISGTLGFISEEFSLNELQLGSVVGVAALGVIIALPFAGFASNILGRKRTLQIIALMYVASAMASALAPSYIMLLCARFLGGLAFTSITMASMYIGEVSPPKLRGKLVSMTQINIVVGLSAAYFINYLILQATNSGASWVDNLGITQYTWRWMLGAEIIPAFLWLVLLSFIPLSPAWLVLKSRKEDARNSLSKFYPSEELDVRMQEMQTSLESSTESRSLIDQMKEIMSKPMRVIFIVALTIAIAQQSTGINAILFYAPTVIEQLGAGTDAAFLQAIWIGITSVVFTVLSLLLIDKIGRRPMVLLGMVWIICSLALCSYGFKKATYQINENTLTELTEINEVQKLSSLVGVEYNSDTAFKNAIISQLGEVEARKHSSVLLQKCASINALLILFGILSFIAAFNFSVGPIMWVLFSEMFPISIRGIAIPFFAIITSITSFLVQQFFPYQLATMGSSAIFLFYAATVAIGLLILYKYLPETKNMSLEEIQFSMTGKIAPTKNEA